MYNYDSDTIDDLRKRLKAANSLLCLICTGLEQDGIPMPLDLLDWWAGYKKEQEETEKPRIQLVN